MIRKKLLFAATLALVAISSVTMALADTSVDTDTRANSDANSGVAVVMEESAFYEADTVDAVPSFSVRANQQYSNTVEMYWDEVSNASDYSVYSYDEKTKTSKKLKNVSTGEYGAHFNTIYDEEPTVNTPYQLYVEAYDSSNKLIAKSSMATVWYIRGPRFKTAFGDNQITLTWQGDASQADGYQIEYYDANTGYDVNIIGTVAAKTGKCSFTFPIKDGTDCGYIVAGYKIIDGKKWISTVYAHYVDYVGKAPTPALEVTSESIDLSWDYQSNANYYYIYRAEGSGSYKLICERCNEPRYSDQDVVDGKMYSYKISAVVGVHEMVNGYTDKVYHTGIRSDAISAVYKKDRTGALATPVVTASNASTGVSVKWNQIGNADGYVVYRKEAGQSFASIATVTGQKTTSYVDKSAKSGKTYYYTVRAVNSKVRSSYKSSSAISYLAAPKVTTENGANGMKVYWNKISGATSYYVYRKISGGSYEKIATISSGSTVSYYDKGALKSGKNYYYTVKAISGSTTSSYKSSAVIKYLSAVTPTVSATSGKVTVKWSKVTGAKGYYVYRKTESGSWTKIGTITDGATVSYTDTTAKKGTKYYYCVKAYSGSYVASYNTSSAVTAK